jgi:hypothetical protein
MENTMHIVLLCAALAGCHQSTNHETQRYQVFLDREGKAAWRLDKLTGEKIACPKSATADDCLSISE